MHASKEDGNADERHPVLVSACLLGRRCRYDAGENLDTGLLQLLAERAEEAIPFCPEEAGGLSTPRPAASLSMPADEMLAGAGQVLTQSGEDVGPAFRQGAAKALAECDRRGVQRAYLKERSPSCGVCQTHVAGVLVDGPGLTSATLQRAGIETIGIQGRRD